jgi:menaquinone-dependent protoporphyrinogen oxidase
MTALVTAASKHGATGEIAARIGAGLAERGVEVDVKNPQDVHDIDQYDAFVVGSALYMGKWLKAARSFIDAHVDELAKHPTWLFSSGPIVGDPTRPDDPHDAAQGNSLAQTVHAREHKLFADKLDKSKLNFAEKAAVRAAHSSQGDHRNWNAIDEWAAAIAQELQQTHANPRS